MDTTAHPDFAILALLRPRAVCLPGQTVDNLACPPPPQHSNSGQHTRAILSSSAPILDVFLRVALFGPVLTLFRPRATACRSKSFRGHDFVSPPSSDSRPLARQPQADAYLFPPDDTHITLLEGVVGENEFDYSLGRNTEHLLNRLIVRLSLAIWSCAASFVLAQ